MSRDLCRPGDALSSDELLGLALRTGAGGVDLDGRAATVGAYTFHLSPHDDASWICQTTPRGAQRKAAAERRARVEAVVAREALSRPWHDFVAWYVARSTARKAFKGYRVRKSKRGWAIFFGGVQGARPTVDADASTVYGWLERLPLVVLSREADAARAEAFAAAGRAGASP